MKLNCAKIDNTIDEDIDITEATAETTTDNIDKNVADTDSLNWIGSARITCSIHSKGTTTEEKW